MKVTTAYDFSILRRHMDSSPLATNLMHTRAYQQSVPSTGLPDRGVPRNRVGSSRPSCRRRQAWPRTIKATVSVPPTALTLRVTTWLSGPASPRLPARENAMAVLRLPATRSQRSERRLEAECPSPASPPCALPSCALGTVSAT